MMTSHKQSAELSALRAQAESHLKDIAYLKAHIEVKEQAYTAEVEKLKEKYLPEINALEDSLAMEDKALVSLMKKNKDNLFDGEDKIKLSCGVLLHTTEYRLTLPRDALGRIKENGWIEAIRVTESIAREIVERWPIERIVAVGGDKKLKEKFEYEVKR
jgi:phage host-nuclease inhibitor protein Gam